MQVHAEYVMLSSKSSLHLRFLLFLGGGSARPLALKVNQISGHWPFDIFFEIFFISIVLYYVKSLVRQV